MRRCAGSGGHNDIVTNPNHEGFSGVQCITLCSVSSGALILILSAVICLIWKCYVVRVARFHYPLTINLVLVHNVFPVAFSTHNAQGNTEVNEDIVPSNMKLSTKFHFFPHLAFPQYIDT